MTPEQLRQRIRTCLTSQGLTLDVRSWLEGDVWTARAEQMGEYSRIHHKATATAEQGETIALQKLVHELREKLISDWDEDQLGRLRELEYEFAGTPIVTTYEDAVVWLKNIGMTAYWSQDQDEHWHCSLATGDFPLFSHGEGDIETARRAAIVEHVAAYQRSLAP